MAKYVIDEELRNRLLKLTDSLLHNQIVHPQVITEIQTSLQNTEKVIEEEEYDASVEEMILIAKEMGLL